MTELEHLPDDFAQNLADMTPEQRIAVQVDKVRWFEAWRMFMEWPAHQIRAWLADQTDDQFRADMARRLNKIKARINGNQTDKGPTRQERQKQPKARRGAG